MTHKFTEDGIQSWTANADRWTRAVRNKSIASRVVATDRAILDAVAKLKPKRVLDVGCGEGWLARALANDIRCEIVGVDSCAPLIGHARAAHDAGTYLALSYEEIASGTARLAGPFDVTVCNFSLLDEDPVPLLAGLRRLMASGGAVIIQTVHPLSLGDGVPYADGWRQESFAAFDEAGWAPMPWYFRTFASWLTVVADAGLSVSSCSEPRHPETGMPLSLVLECICAGDLPAAGKYGTMP
ncbi:MAG: methyltransferase domain-containing protein [Alphaproteobacteria bacterium]|nr:methyltransferase domain-containing protein [Alphaproteobacteria bacterium]